MSEVPPATVGYAIDRKAVRNIRMPLLRGQRAVCQHVPVFVRDSRRRRPGDRTFRKSILVELDPDVSERVG